jgi:hypothetical protein
MSIGIVGSAAGAPLAQAKGTDVEKNREAAGNQQRAARAEAQADSAAGIGETDGKNHETNERDADGRMPYSFAQDAKPEDQPADASADAAKPPAIDPTGTSGTRLDLTG